MQWMLAILVFIVCRFVFFRRKTIIIINQAPQASSEPQWYYQELTDEQKRQCSDINERLLRKYPDAEVGEVYPELVYKIQSERYSRGEITKEQFDALTDTLLKNIPE